MKRGAKVKFPDPKSCKVGDPAVLCPAERVLNLYNQYNGKNAKRISKNVRVWFVMEAKQKSWAGVHFLPEVQSNYGAGCVLFLPPQQVNVVMTITETTLILAAQDE